MLKIAFLAGKGGVTKSGEARSVAARLAWHGLSVAGYDMDGEQGTFRRWALLRDEDQSLKSIPAFFVPNIMRLRRELEKNSYECAVVDGSAYASKETFEAAELVDLVVIPTTISMDDMSSTIRVAEGLTEKGIPNERIAFAFSGIMEGDNTTEAREFLEESGYYCIAGAIERRKGYRNALDKGRAYFETAFPGLNHPAIEHLDAIISRALEVKK